jgi:hypothetical protein
MFDGRRCPVQLDHWVQGSAVLSAFQTFVDPLSDKPAKRGALGLCDSQDPFKHNHRQPDTLADHYFVGNFDRLVG